MNKKYEMLRFWLLGSWMAHDLGLRFYLLNLVPSEREKNIEGIYKKHIKEDSSRSFLRITWEGIHQFIRSSELKYAEKDRIIRYLENKTIGYRNGKRARWFILGSGFRIGNQNS